MPMLQYILPCSIKNRRITPFRQSSAGCLHGHGSFPRRLLPPPCSTVCRFPDCSGRSTVAMWEHGHAAGVPKIIPPMVNTAQTSESHGTTNEIALKAAIQALRGARSHMKTSTEDKV